MNQTEFESVIGLEVHAQLSTQTKLWCNCKTMYDATANSLTCPVCLGLPGSLPVLNESVVNFAIKLGLAINADIREYSEFSRKNYFYQDLPVGYQITQYEFPIIENGTVKAEVGEVGEDKYEIEVRIERAHIENDTGKTIHDDVITGKDKSFVDFNRAGTPLLEIVTKPDLRSGKEALYYLQQLRQILRFIDICDGNMEEGSLRCDANVSIRPKGTETLGTRAEVKNMNSFRNVEKAINFEIDRQKKLILSGQKIVQETRMWDATLGETVSMRTKEEAMDYRYFPEPDLIPLQITKQFIDSIKNDLPELPNKRRARFKSEFQLNDDDAKTITSSIELADYYEALVKLTRDPKLSANWLLSEVLRITNERSIDITDFPIKTDRLSQLILLIKDNTISGKIAKTIFEEMLNSSDLPKQIIEKKGLVQISDEDQLSKIADEIIASNQNQLKEYLSGKDKLYGFFVGQMMKATQGKANPSIVNKILKEKLK